MNKFNLRTVFAHIFVKILLHSVHGRQRSDACVYTTRRPQKSLPEFRAYVNVDVSAPLGNVRVLVRSSVRLVWSSCWLYCLVNAPFCLRVCRKFLVVAERLSDFVL